MAGWTYECTGDVASDDLPHDAKQLKKSTISLDFQGQSQYGHDSSVSNVSSISRRHCIPKFTALSHPLINAVGIYFKKVVDDDVVTLFLCHFVNYWLLQNLMTNMTWSKI